MRAAQRVLDTEYRFIEAGSYTSSTPIASTSRASTSNASQPEPRNASNSITNQNQVRGRKIRHFTIQSGVDNKVVKYENTPNACRENGEGEMNKTQLYNELVNALIQESRKLSNTITKPSLTPEQVDEMERSMMQLGRLVEILMGHVQTISARYRSSESSSNEEVVADRTVPETSETVQHNDVDGNSISSLQIISPKREKKAIVYRKEPLATSSASNFRTGSSQWNRKKRNQPKRNLKEKMVPIGDGNAQVPEKVLCDIVGKTHTVVTRKLLAAVFPRRVLASHSLTGRPSPAFPNKPAKKRLNEGMVNDIIKTVMENCNTQECHVRTSITTKCADEAKMFRNRLQKNKTSKKENLPPSDFESEDEAEDEISDSLSMSSDSKSWYTD